MPDAPAHYGTVEDVERLGPSMVRVVFGGEGLCGFDGSAFTDAYLMLLFPQPGSPFEVPFDTEQALRLPREQRPIPRRFTIRRWDAARGELVIDFVTHGDEGVAGRWAQAARPGDLLQFRGPGGGYSPDSGADWHLFVGDESALPAIAASLERVPAGVPARLVALVDGPDDELALRSPGDLEVTWLHRDPADTEQLAGALRALEFPAGRVQGFVHGEAGETRAVRRHLLAERGVDAAALSLSPYWRRHYDDEAWREVKRQFLAEQAADV